MKKMTENQANLLKFIQEYRIKYGNAPTLQEMVEALKVSDNKSILGIITALAKSGYVVKEGRKSRSISLTGKGQDFLIGYLLPLEYRQGGPTPAMQLRQSNEMTKTSVTVSSPTSDSLAYQNNQVKADGTSIGNEFQSMVETAASLTINRFFGGSIPIDPKHQKDLSFNLARYFTFMFSQSVIVNNFAWAFMLAGLTWVNVHIVSDEVTALAFSIIGVVAIKKLINQ